jgi:hypothetical protein
MTRLAASGLFCENCIDNLVRLRALRWILL